MRTPEGQAATAFALERLAKLRPENLFVLLRVGQSAIESGDRTRASGAYLRIRELAWQALPSAQEAVASVIDALEAGDVEAARRPAILLQNVLLVTPMFQGGLKELTTGVQGVPVARFLRRAGAHDVRPPDADRAAGHHDRRRAGGRGRAR